MIATLENAVRTHYPSINAAAVDLDINTWALRALLSGDSWPSALRVAELETRLGCSCGLHSRLHLGRPKPTSNRGMSAKPGMWWLLPEIRSFPV